MILKSELFSKQTFETVNLYVITALSSWIPRARLGRHRVGNNR